MILQATGGVPRLINQLCDFAMLYAFEADSQVVNAEMVQDVLDENLFFCAGRSHPLRLVQTGQEDATPKDRLQGDEAK